MTTKKRISKTESIKQILHLLREGYATEEILEEISSNWVLPETTFYNHFKEAKKTYNNELQEQKKELEAIRLTEVKKAAQKGLKSKFERDVEIQDEIEHYKSVLSGEKKVSFILGQKVSATENREPEENSRSDRGINQTHPGKHSQQGSTNQNCTVPGRHEQSHPVKHMDRERKVSRMGRYCDRKILRKLQERHGSTVLR